MDGGGHRGILAGVVRQFNCCPAEMRRNVGGNKNKNVGRVWGSWDLCGWALWPPLFRNSLIHTSSGPFAALDPERRKGATNEHK
jgi:hypothetical protein